MRLLFSILSALLVAACDTQPPPGSPLTAGAGKPVVVQPGESVGGVDGYFHYDLSNGSGDEDSRRYGSELCDHAALGGTTAVFEVVSVSHITEGVPDCDRDYAQPASLVRVQVLGNVAGSALPASMDAAFIYFGWNWDTPDPGDLGLVTIREDAGEWLWLGWVPLQVSADPLDVQADLPTWQTTDLPSTFPALVQELGERKADYQRFCSFARWKRGMAGPSMPEILQCGSSRAAQGTWR